MSANCGHEDNGIVRMAERASGCEVVRRGTGGSRDTDSISLNSSKVFVIPKQLDR